MFLGTTHIISAIRCLVTSRLDKGLAEKNFQVQGFQVRVQVRVLSAQVQVRQKWTRVRTRVLQVCI